jgi:hypothetical protein
VDPFGPGIQAYVFERDGAEIIAMWSAADNATVRLPGRRAADSVVVDIMGREHRPAGDGPLEIEVGPDITYVVPAAPQPELP